MIKSNSKISILSSKIDSSKIGNVGNIEIKNNFIVKITEKSFSSKSNLSWAGIAFFKGNEIFKIIKNLTPSKRGEFEITEAMNLTLNNKIENFICDKYVDAGTISGILELNKTILEQNHMGNLNQLHCNTKIKNPIHLGKNCKIGDNVELGPFVSIGNNVNIGDDVKLEYVLVLDNSNIGSNKIITNSVIDSNNNILS